MKYKIVAIASQPRTGSTYLCDLLQSSGPIGKGSNYEYTGSDGFLKPDLPGLLRDRTSDYNITLINLHFPGFVTFNRMDFTNFNVDVRWIWIKRKDVVAQVISNVIAKYTGKWAFDDIEVKKISNIDEVYNFEEIHNEVREVEHRNKFYQRYFSLNKIPVLPLTYEDHILNQPYLDLIKNMVNYCEIELDFDNINIDFSSISQIQRNEINTQLIDRYKFDLQNRKNVKHTD